LPWYRYHDAGAVMFRKTGAIGRIITLAIAVFVTIAPFYWIFVLSTQDPASSFGEPRFFYHPSFSAFKTVWSDRDFLAATRMSVITGALTVLISLAVSIPAAYILVKRKVRKRSGLLSWLFIAYLFPDFIIALPLYSVLQNMGLYDTSIGLALAYQGFMAPLAMWLLMAFFKAVPDEIGQAAKIDGCSEWATLRRIYLPVVRSGVATVAILVAINVWNEVTIALALTSSNPTLPIVVSSYKGYAALRWDQLSAAILLSVIPVLIFAAFAQKQIVRGLTEGAFN